jgi:hypothetical protein
LAEALRVAAETAAEFNQFAVAIEYRGRLSALLPDEVANSLELARALAAGGKNDEAMTQLASLISDRRVARQIRWAALWIAPEIVKQEGWSSFDQKIRAIKDREMVAAVEAQSMLSRGRPEDAIKGLDDAVMSGPSAQLKLFRALSQKNAGRESEALQSLLDSMIAFGDAWVAAPFGATEDEPRWQVIRLCAKQGRPRAALRLAGADERLKGRFVLATSEKLLLRAIANIGGQAKKDRMTDEPSFQKLSKTTTPHFMTVWVNQTQLNDDWYFKRYWAMRNAEDLKHLSAGIFDLELQNKRWVERREFLLEGRAPNPGAALSKQSLQQIERIIPADAPFAQIRSVGGDRNAAVEMIRDALFDGKIDAAKGRRRRSWSRYYGSDFEVADEDEESYGGSRYSYLSDDYNLDVDDPDAAGERGAGDIDDAVIRSKGVEKFSAALGSALEAASPSVAAKIAEPHAVEGPLFAEFRRAAITAMLK